eukprot:CAMPEP_0185924510 /NCGR_PEP_ID=MMETSP0924C-20121207/12526_1 /TAXON_ID=321610 /ORGANISM="Perkinsus chesapeaki, Strain ATCC PRA-65" /LENGTH=41 /DNA_ID= /DNA_START= /DNA_END= /DNA_ORIENTATION=
MPPPAPPGGRGPRKVVLPTPCVGAGHTTKCTGKVAHTAPST